LNYLHVLGFVKPHGACYFLIRRRPSKLGFQRRNSRFHFAGFLPDGARHPVYKAQFVKYGAPYARNGVGFKFYVFFRIVFFYRVNKAENAETYKIVKLNIIGHSYGDSAGHILYKRGVLFNKEFPDFRVPRFTVLLPQFLFCFLFRHSQTYLLIFI